MHLHLIFYIIFLPIIMHGQVVSETNIIFESKKSIILNNGSEYELIKETPLEAIMDVTIPITHSIEEKTFVLNRVLLIKNEEDEKKELIEWITGTSKFYKLRDSKKSG